MIKIGLAEFFGEFTGAISPERLFDLHNQQEADSFRDAASLVRLPSDSSVEAVVAWGLMIRPLRERYPGVPVVEVRVSACELYRNMAECRERFAGKKIGVIAPSGMLLGVEHLLGAPLPEACFYTLRDAAHGRELLGEAIRDGCGCILSDSDISALAGELGVDSMVLRPSEDAVYGSITEAKRLALLARRKREAAPCVVFDQFPPRVQKRAVKRLGSRLLFFPMQDNLPVGSRRVPGSEG